MDEYEHRRKELLEELARRFRDSAGTMRGIAHRIHEVARADGQSRQRLARASRSLCDCLGEPEASVPYTYLEYLEFGSAGEFRRFREQPPITDADLKAVDLDDLARRLQEDPRASDNENRR